MHVAEATRWLGEQYLLTPDATLRLAIRLLTESHLDALPVVGEKGELIGVFSKYSLYRALLSGSGLSEPIAPFFKKDVVYVPSDKVIDDVSFNVKSTPVGQWVVVDDGGRPIGMLTKDTVVRVLLDQKDALNAELCALLESVPLGLVAVDRHLSIRHFNQAAEELLGLVRGYSEGVGLPRVIPGVNVEEVLNTGLPAGPQRREVGDKKLVVSVSPVKKNGQVIGAVTVVQDLTQYERLAAELESVRRLHQTLQTILSSVSDALVVTDENGVVTMANNVSLSALVAQRLSVVGKRLSDVFSSRIAEIVLKTGVPETDVGLVDGVPVILNCSPIKEENRVVGTVTTVLSRNLPRIRELVSRIHFLERQVEYYKKELRGEKGSKYTFDDIVTCDEEMIRLKKEAALAAKGFSNILIIGESGTGKELFAHAIHSSSPRRFGPFIRVNCAAIPEALMEAELFGYADGAFTGARKGGKPGKFELANGGTIFLDEIGDMSLSLQAKVLRVLQERELERVGGTNTIELDIRVIAATNQDLPALVKQGLFRRDLFYRLNVITLRIPPLRERKKDILYIAHHYIERFNRTLGTNVKGISPTVSQILESYAWPGNVRELVNVIERAVTMKTEGVIDVDDLPVYLRGEDCVNGHAEVFWRIDENMTYRDALRAFEKHLLLSALQRANGRCSAAARLLGLSRSRFYEKMAEHSIPPSERPPRRKTKI